MPYRKLADLPDDFFTPGRLLGVDVGEKTYGLALSDSGRMIANPLKTLPRGEWRADKEIFQKLMKTEGITALVVGLPLALKGDFTAQTQRADSFASLVEEELGVPVLLWDERLSTAAAEDALFSQRTGRQKRAGKKEIKQQVDAVAAALFLQSVLEALRYRNLKSET